jgi:hypothetical protein
MSSVRPVAGSALVLVSRLQQTGRSFVPPVRCNLSRRIFQRIRRSNKNCGPESIERAGRPPKAIATAAPDWRGDEEPSSSSAWGQDEEGVDQSNKVSHVPPV